MTTTTNKILTTLPPTLRTQALAGFTSLNPHEQGIDLYTAIENILDTDSHLANIGDVAITPTTLTTLLTHLATFAPPTPPTNTHPLP